MITVIFMKFVRMCNMSATESVTAVMCILPTYYVPLLYLFYGLCMYVYIEGSHCTGYS